jgi:HSP20 family protein
MILRNLPALVSASPFADIPAFNRVFSNGFAGTATLPVDITESADGLTLVFEAPGVDTKQVKVELENGILTVSVERPAPAREEATTVLRSERAYGTVTRQLELPYAIERDGIEASLKDGLLTVKLRRAEADRPLRIEVKG